MERNFFSVIIPTYNRSKILERTLIHILNQSFDCFEVIIVDDGGSDNTEQMVKDLNDPRLRYFRQDNNGPLIARYSAALKAEGTWLAFCDSDDLWEKDYLQHCYQSILRAKSKVVFTDYQVEGEESPRINSLLGKGFFDDSKISVDKYFFLLDALSFYNTLMRQQPLMISAFLIERDYYHHIGGIDISLDVIGSEDSHLTQRAVGNTDLITFINLNLVLLGRGDDNVSSSYIRNLEGGLSIIIDIYTRALVPKKLMSSTKENIYKHRIELANQYYWCRELKKSLTHLSKLDIYHLVSKNVLFLLAKIAFRSVVK